ncbi:hypothetical protein SAMN04488047_10584 [Tranquillimonas alkanivorans]|uniref:Lipoprotein n=1 Tax=Tranquillimonas alkanivorans TaxID=441119 RepID=A0A1I5PFR4_9RHOB|nr:hypothetical protein SAMN04488047_10584 [Tranquillimonas alkanivorans]
MKRVAAALGLLAVAAACAPASTEVAERRCAERARAAAEPVSSIGGVAELGYGSGGMHTDLDVSLTAGVNLGGGADPYAAYDRCVRRATGQGPARPLVLE